MKTLPKPNQMWQHTNGGLYIVQFLTNESSTKPEYPVTVVYRGVANGLLWSRPMSDWCRSFTFIKDEY